MSSRTNTSTAPAAATREARRSVSAGKITGASYLRRADLTRFEPRPQENAQRNRRSLNVPDNASTAEIISCPRPLQARRTIRVRACPRHRLIHEVQQASLIAPTFIHTVPTIVPPDGI